MKKILFPIIALLILVPLAQKFDKIFKTTDNDNITGVQNKLSYIQ